MALKVFIFAERGHGSAVLEAASRHGANVVGVCATPDPPLSVRVKSEIGKLIGRTSFIHRDPFAQFRHPSRLAPRFLPRTEMGAVEAFLRAERADVILCCGFPKLIPNQILSTAKHAINIHPGLLPERPGGTPNRWAIRLGDAETGVTAHYMTERFDAGDIVFRKAIPIPPGATWGDVETALTPLVVDAALFVVDALQGGRALAREPQASHRSMPSLRAKRQYIDWSEPADSIMRLCLAMRPKSGALTHWNGQKICIWQMQPYSEAAVAGTPGTVLHVDRDGPVIATGTSAIVVSHVLVAGKVRPGQRLGLKPGDRLE